MALADLMATLQKGTADAEMRMSTAKNTMLQAMADNQAIPAPVARPRGRARGSSKKGFARGTGGRNLKSPLKNYTISSEYGPRTHPVNGGQSNHTGVDLAAPNGTPIRAASSGRVKESNQNDSVYGNQVILGHGKGFQTMYGHMSDSLVKPGEVVKRGQIIGYVGSTGLSTGNHLHYETWKKGTPVNPMKYI